MIALVLAAAFALAGDQQPASKLLETALAWDLVSPMPFAREDVEILFKRISDVKLTKTEEIGIRLLHVHCSCPNDEKVEKEELEAVLKLLSEVQLTDLPETDRRRAMIILRTTRCGASMAWTLAASLEGGSPELQAQVHATRAHVHFMRRGSPTTVNHSCELALRLDPNCLDALMLIATSKVYSGTLAVNESADVFGRWRANCWRSPDALHQLSTSLAVECVFLRGKGEYEDALKCAESLIALRDLDVEKASLLKLELAISCNLFRQAEDACRMARKPSVTRSVSRMCKGLQGTRIQETPNDIEGAASAAVGHHGPYPFLIEWERDLSEWGRAIQAARDGDRASAVKSYAKLGNPGFAQVKQIGPALLAMRSTDEGERAHGRLRFAEAMPNLKSRQQRALAAFVLRATEREDDVPLPPRNVSQDASSKATMGRILGMSQHAINGIWHRRFSTLSELENAIDRPVPENVFYIPVFSVNVANWDPERP